MRISSDKDDPGFENWCRLGDRQFDVKILLDDVEVRHCTVADEEQGFVIRAKLNADGKIYAVGNEIAMETVYGTVIVVLPGVTP